MGEQLTLVPPPEKTIERVSLGVITGAEETIPPASLIGSMMKHGQLQPIIVVDHVGAATDWLTVVAGRRRVAAARHLGWGEIDAVIYAEGDINPSEVGLIENAMRSANPMSEVKMITVLLREGKSESEIAALTGMSVATIRKRLQLTSLDTEAVHAVENGRLAIGVAEEMAKLPLGVQGRIMTEHREGRITGKDVREAREVGRQGQWTAIDFGGMVPDPVGVTWRDTAIDHLEAAWSVVPADHPNRKRIDFAVSQIMGMMEEHDANSGSA